MTALLIAVSCACAISKQEPELIGEPALAEDAGADAAAPPSGSEAGRSGNPSAARSSSEAGSAGEPTSGAGGMETSGPDAAVGGSGGSGSTPSQNTGDGGSNGARPTPDAGMPPIGAGTDDAAQAWDDTACAFELAECLVLDPFGFQACIEMNMKKCNLLTGDAATPTSGAVSPACSMQTAQCIMANPDKAQECLAMQETCTL